MNWAQFKDYVSNLALGDAMVASWSLTQEVVGLSPFTLMANIFFVTEFVSYSEKHLGTTPLPYGMMHKQWR